MISRFLTAFLMLYTLSTPAFANEYYILTTSEGVFELPEPEIISLPLCTEDIPDNCLAKPPEQVPAKSFLPKEALAMWEQTTPQRRQAFFRLVINHDNQVSIFYINAQPDVGNRFIIGSAQILRASTLPSRRKP